MAKVNYKVRLEKLLTNELSSLSNDRKQVTSAYKSLMDILQVPQLNKHLSGHHELIFQCLSMIILTSFNQFFDDEELTRLLYAASNACVLSMSQNQIIDGWLQNVEERTFEKPDIYDEDEDDDDLYEDATDTESEDDDDEDEDEEEEAPKQNKNIKLNRNEKKQPFRHDAKVVSFKEEVSIVPPSRSNQRDVQISNLKKNRGVDNEPSTRGNRQQQGKENKPNKGRRAPPFDNKYGVDLRLYDCYICGEYGHVQYDCPKKHDQARGKSQQDVSSKPKKSRQQRKSVSSLESTSKETTPMKIQDIYNACTTLLNSLQTTAERNETFDRFLSDLEKLQEQRGENLSKIFLEKEPFFYSLFSHIAQHDFLFTTDQYSKLYHFKHVLLPKQHQVINEDRSMFARQRILVPFEIISTHIRTVTQIQQAIFNDFEEYILRATSPISMILYDVIKFLLRSNIHVHEDHMKNLTDTILFKRKKDIFSNEQLIELKSCLSIRIKRFERTQAKIIWKERLNLFKANQLPADINPWINEFDQILQSNTDDDDEQLSNDVVHHAMWYFGVLMMSSSGHLNSKQYEHVLTSASQSRLFNEKQKFYFQFYLEQTHAPITIEELNQIGILLKTTDKDEKEKAYQQIRMILNRTKPTFDEKDSVDNLPIVDNYVLSRLILLVETICSDHDGFSSKQCKELLDQFLDHSSIVRPIPSSEENRLKRFYSRPMSLNELKKFCASSSFDLKTFLVLIKNETIVKNDEVYDYLTEIIGTIFRNRQRYSNENCEELKRLIDRQIFGKRRVRLINENYQEYRLKKKDLPSITPSILNQFLTEILSPNQQIKAIGEFFILIEEISCSIDFNEITLELEITRCLLSTILLVIVENKSSKILEYHQRLKNLLEKEKQFFSHLLTQQQLQLIDSHLISNDDNQKKTTEDHSISHRELFSSLQSNDSSINATIVEKFRLCLLDEQLPSNISPAKFIQALQTIVRNHQKFSQVSLDEWQALISKNRGRIFSNDAQCDELLLNILFIRLKMPNDSLKSIQHLTQSKKPLEKNEGLEKLIVLLSNTQMTNERMQNNHLPTISNSLYHLITSVTFDERFPNSQIRKCLTQAKHSWLLNAEHRQKVNG